MHAIDGLDVSLLRGRHVFVDTAYLNSGSLSAEQSFAIGELRARVLQAGARVVPAKDRADVVVEVRSEALGIDRWDNLLGIPAFAVPGAVSSTGAVPIITPELALLKTNKQHGYASFSFVAYWADTGELLTSSGPAMGETLREDFWFLGVGPRKSGNIPTTDYPKEPEPKP
jgi:hypothetical protein